MIPASVALYIVAAYRFTSSTSFTNPAPAHVPMFILAQLAGAAAGAFLGSALFRHDRPLSVRLRRSGMTAQAAWHPADGASRSLRSGKGTRRPEWAASHRSSQITSGR